MTKTTIRWRIAAPADAVWALMGDFHGTPRINPDVAESRAEEGGAVRRLVLRDGGEFLERMTTRDEAARMLAYEIIATHGMTVPFDHYDGVYRVIDDVPGTSAIFEITGNYVGGAMTEADRENDIRAFYDPCLEGVARALGI